MRGLIDEGATTFGDPVARRDGCAELAGEMRYHVLREQFIAAQLRRGRSPVVVEEQEGAETAVARLDQLLDLRDRVLRGADHRETGGVVVGDDLGGRVALDRSGRQDV